MHGFAEGTRLRIVDFDAVQKGPIGGEPSNQGNTPVTEHDRGVISAWYLHASRGGELPRGRIKDFSRIQVVCLRAVPAGDQYVSIRQRCSSVALSRGECVVNRVKLLLFRIE